jgi:hypothetical protein
MEVALAIHGEVDRGAPVVRDAVEGDPVPLDRVRSTFCAEAAAFRMALQQSDRVQCG